MKDQRLQLMWGSGYEPCVMFHGSYYVLTSDSENTKTPARVVDPETAIHTYMFRTTDYSVIAESAVAKALKLMCAVLGGKVTKRADSRHVLRELLRGYMDIEAGDMFVSLDGLDTLGIMVFAGNGEQLWIDANSVTHRQKNVRDTYGNLSALPEAAQGDVLYLLGFQFPIVDNDMRKLKDAYNSHKIEMQTMLEEVTTAPDMTSSTRTAALVILHQALNRVRTADAVAKPIDGKTMDFQAICNSATRSQIINQLATDIAMELNVVLNARARTC